MRITADHKGEMLPKTTGSKSSFYVPCDLQSLNSGLSKVLFIGDMEINSGYWVVENFHYAHCQVC